MWAAYVFAAALTAHRRVISASVEKEYRLLVSVCNSLKLFLEEKSHIAHATIIEKTVDDDVYFAFEYPFMNDVMRIVKEEEPEILEQAYDMDCLMRLRIRCSMMPKLRARLEKVETLRFIEDEQTKAEV